MLNKFRFDLSKADASERDRVVAQVDQASETGVKRIKPSVFEAFFEETIDVESLIPLPPGCTVKKQSE